MVISQPRDGDRRKFRILHDASRDSRLTRGALSILAFLLEHERDDRTANATHTALAAFAGITATNVSKALTRLEGLGYVETLAAGHRLRPSTYRVHLPQLTHVDDDTLSLKTPVEFDNVSDDDDDGSGIAQIANVVDVDGTLAIRLKWETGQRAGTLELAELDLDDDSDHVAQLIAATDTEYGEFGGMVGQLVRFDGQNFHRF